MSPEGLQVAWILIPATEIRTCGRTSMREYREGAAELARELLPWALALVGVVAWAVVGFIAR
jgi:hypothetical protein